MKNVNRVKEKEIITEAEQRELVQKNNQPMRFCLLEFPDSHYVLSER